MCPPIVPINIIKPTATSTVPSPGSPPPLISGNPIPYVPPGSNPLDLSFGSNVTKDPNSATANPNEALPPGWSVLAIDKREKELKSFIEKVDKATTKFKNGIYLGELWPSIKIHGETIYKSTIETFNSSKGIPAKGIIPTELSMTVDGISDINIGEAFVIQKGVLPSKYDKFGFIVVGVDQTIKNNRWTTNIRAQTFNIGELDNTEITTAQTRITKFGFY